MWSSVATRYPDGLARASQVDDRPVERDHSSRDPGVGLEAATSPQGEGGILHDGYPATVGGEVIADAQPA